MEWNSNQIEDKEKNESVLKVKYVYFTADMTFSSPQCLLQFTGVWLVFFFLLRLGMEFFPPEYLFHFHHRKFRQTFRFMTKKVYFSHFVRVSISITFASLQFSIHRRQSQTPSVYFSGLMCIRHIFIITVEERAGGYSFQFFLKVVINFTSISLTVSVQKGDDERACFVRICFECLITLILRYFNIFQ